MQWRPRVVYGTDDTTLDLNLSQRHWSPSSVAVGGRDISATGIPAAYRVRRDALQRVTLRVWESEWPAVLAWLEWAQGQQTFAWYPDQDAAGSYTVYLHEPAMGEPIEPVRDEQFPLIYEMTIVLRSMSGAFSDIYHTEGE